MRKFIYRIWSRKENKYIVLGGVYNQISQWKVWSSEVILHNREKFSNIEDFEVHKSEIKIAPTEKLDLNRNSI